MYSMQWENNRKTDTATPNYQPPPILSKNAELPSTRHTIHTQLASTSEVEINIDSYAPNEASTPFFWVGSTIAGELSLKIPPKGSPHLHLDQHPKAVSFKLVGYRNLGLYEEGNAAGDDLVAGYEREFLSIPIKLQGDVDASDVKHSDQSKSDAYRWSFSVTIPTTYQAVLDNKSHKVFPTPPSFKRSLLGETIDYQLVLAIKKGTLRNDEIVKRPILVSPSSIPPNALSETLASPSESPGTWRETSADLTIRRGGEEELASIKLYTPKMLFHPLGSPIPLVVAFKIKSSADPQALYIALRESLDITLEALYLQGSKASEGFDSADTTTLDNLPQPFDTGADMTPETKEALILFSDEEEIEKVDVKVNLGAEKWVDGKVITQSNMTPSFVSPHIRLAYELALRLDTTSTTFEIINGSSPPSKRVSKLYNGFSKTPPLLSHPVILTTHAAADAPYNVETLTDRKTSQA